MSCAKINWHNVSQPYVPTTVKNKEPKTLWQLRRPAWKRGVIVVQIRNDFEKQPNEPTNNDAKESNNVLFSKEPIMNGLPL